MTLTGFLLARYTEVEGAARAAQPWANEGRDELGRVDWRAQIWNPAHMLAKCASERRIVGWHRDRGLDFCDECGWSMPCPTLRALVVPYAAHPDFLPEWAP